MIVVNYAVLPSHGRITAEKINQRKMTSTIPVYFVDGKEGDNSKIRSFARAITREELKRILSRE